MVRSSVVLNSILGWIMCATLVAGCASPNPQSNTSTTSNTNSTLALVGAAEVGDNSRLKSLLAQGANPNAQPRGATALMAASQNGHLETVDLLIASGADVNQSNRDGWTALLFAAYNGQARVADSLLRHGGRIDERLKDGRTPLMMAIIGHHVDVVKLLLDRGCNVNAQDSNGTSPAIFAAAVGDVSIARMLVAKSCDLSARDKNGRTAIDWAKQKRDDNLVSAFATATPNETVDMDAIAEMVKTASNSRQVASDCLTKIKEAPDGTDAGDARKRMVGVVASLQQLPSVCRRTGIPLRNGVLFGAGGVRIMNGTVDLKAGGSGLIAPEKPDAANVKPIAERNLGIAKVRAGMTLAETLAILGSADDTFEQADGKNYQRIALYSLENKNTGIIWFDRTDKVTLVFPGK